MADYVVGRGTAHAGDGTFGHHLVEAELAEARAQLASANRWISELVNDLSEARAQIAAKDAALREIYAQDGVGRRARALISKALAAPARETE